MRVHGCILDFHGVPPNCDIDFDLDLELGTKPMYISPYWMAPTKLKKLEEKLEDLLKKGFITPIVSP